MKLLLPYDASPASEAAVRLLLGWRGDRAAVQASLLNVQAPPVHWWPTPLVDPQQLETVLKEEGMRTLAGALDALRAAGFEAAAGAEVGTPAAAILEAATTAQSDLILMGTRGRGALPGTALGSVAMRVVHGARRPVMLAREGMRFPAGLGSALRVLVPVDGSRRANKAVRLACGWADWLGIAFLEVHHFTKPLTLFEQIMPPHGDALRQWAGAGADQALAPAKKLLTGSGIAHELLTTSSGDDAGQAILRRVEEGRFDVVCMGTRGLGSLARTLTGSVSLKVASASSVPLVLVP